MRQHSDPAHRVTAAGPTLVSTLDPASNRVVRTIDHLIEPPRETGPTSTAYLDGDLWVSVE